MSNYKFKYNAQNASMFLYKMVKYTNAFAHCTQWVCVPIPNA